MMGSRAGLGVALVGAVGMLAGCEIAEDGPLVGPDASLAEARAMGEAQWAEVERLAAREGQTRWVDLPLSGHGAYRGVVSGWASGGASLGYAADLALSVDFARLAVSGTVANVVTEGVAGFAHPEGEIALDGLVVPDGTGTRIVVDGSGPLAGEGIAATFTLDGAGAFVGRAAQGLRGEHVTDFAWTRGPLAGSVSRSDGVFSAAARE